jgi:hypothetical protein
VSDDFYIGYEPVMPARFVSRIRLAAIGLVLLALVVSGALVLAQTRFASATFEFGQTRTFEGRIVERPYPALLVSESSAGVTAYWLVGPGKHGAFDDVKGLEGEMVRAAGSLIERDGDRMIELQSREAVVAIGSRERSPLEPLRSLGPITLKGEIVDSKCHLGVMKPGEGPTHRDCAVRCLLGRITPMFVPGREFVSTGRLALVDADGRPMTELLQAVAGRPVEIRGELLARGPLRFLATTPSAIQVR